MSLHPWMAIGVAVMLAVSFALVAYRVLKGPTGEDRILGIDMLAYVAIGLIALFAMGTGYFVLVDVAVVLALIAFIGTVAFAHYGFARGGRR